MLEPPDFDQIAQWIADLFGAVGETEKESAIAGQLRQVWNARGAADAHAVEERLATLTGWVTSEPYRQHLRDAIEALNRG